MKVLLGIALASTLVTAAIAQDSPFREELKRGDLIGTNMEIITSISELSPVTSRCGTFIMATSRITSWKVAPLSCPVESRCRFRRALLA